MKYVICVFVLSIFVFGQKEQFVAKNPQEIFKLKQHFGLEGEDVIDYSTIENGKKLMIVSKTSIKTIDILTGKVISKLTHEIGKNHERLFLPTLSPNGNLLMFFDYAYSEQMPILIKSKKLAAAIYNLKTGKLAKILEGGVNEIEEAFWSSNGKTLFTKTKWYGKNQESEFCFIDGETLKYRNCISVIGETDDYKMSRNGEKLFARVSNEQKSGLINLVRTNWVGVWDTKTVKLEKSFKLNERAYSFDRFFLTTDEKYIAIDGKVFEVSGSDIPKFQSENRIRGISENGEKFLLEEKKGLTVYGFETLEKGSSIPQIKNDYDLKLTSTEKVLLNQNLRRNCGRTEAFDMDTGRKLWELKLACYYQSSDCFFCSDKTNFVDSIEFVNDGKYFLTTSLKAIRVWNTITGELIQVLDTSTKNLGKKDSEFDDQLKGEKIVWSADRKSIFVQSGNSESIYQFEKVGL